MFHRVHYGASRAPKNPGPPAKFPAPARSPARGGVYFSHFPAPASGQDPAPPIAQTGPRNLLVVKNGDPSRE